ncbi:efflux RND transporter periplasmic adaptor subunit [Candidatus Falkowbacteria bacterium]|nr:efflux RND transporter periplasmic adaptor subunit [Candidatus Falkowbacteria bacterium]
MKEFIKKLLKRKLFWFALIVIIIIAVVAFNAFKGKQPQYVTEKVIKGTLTQTVSETGTMENAAALNLNFQSSGILKEILIEEGDQVTKGQLLATLEAGDLEIGVKQARANYDIAMANLNKLLAGSSIENIRVSEESVNNAKIAYQNAQTSYDTLVVKIDADIKTYEAQVEAAQTALNNVSATYDQSVANARQNLITTIRSKAIAANTSLSFFDYQYINMGNVADLQAKTNALGFYNLASTAKTSLNNLLNKSDDALTESELAQATTLSLSLLDYINSALNSLFIAVASTMSDARYSEALKEQNKTLIKTEQANNSANLVALQAADQNYTNAKLGLTSASDDAKSALQTAQDNLNALLANKDAQIVTAKAQVDSALGAYNLAKAQLALTKAPARNVDVSIYRAQVDQAQAALESAQYKLSYYQIIAPSDGTITFINYKIGEQVSPTANISATSMVKPVIAMLGTGGFQAKVDVPESDIIKVKINDPVEITLDAYGSDSVFTGKVKGIDIAETLISDVVYYQVTVILDSTDKEIKSGMTANVDILTAKKDNVLMVPSRAVKTLDNGTKYVEVLKNSTPKRVNVITGFKGDAGKIEIITGLKEGENVVVFTKQ